MRQIVFVTLLLISCFTAGYSQQSSAGASVVLLAGGVNNTVDPGGALHILSSAELYLVSSGQFVRTGSMREPRVAHIATLLSDRRILVTGGVGGSTRQTLATAEIYDPSLSRFKPVGNMKIARVDHSATRLLDGRVLIAGGTDGTTVTNAVEIFDPITLKFTLTTPLHTARTGHTATLLKSGKVLIEGGINGQFLNTAELFDPLSQKFTHTGPMVHRRWRATATLLADGRVLIAGGGAHVGDCDGCPITSAEIYDPTSNTFVSAGDMKYSRRGHAAVLLSNGRVLITGGSGSEPGGDEQLQSSAEIFNPKTLAFSLIGSMTLARFNHTATLLSSGKVLVAGGSVTPLKNTNTTELYDPKTRSFTAGPSMKNIRMQHTATGLP